MDTTWSRRGLLGLGAAGATAALVGIDATAAGATSSGNGALAPQSAGGLSPAVVTPVDGAVKKSLWFVNFHPLELTGRTLTYGNGLAVTPDGYLLTSLDMPVGSTLVQVDVFGAVGAGTQNWTVLRTSMDSGSATAVGTGADLTTTTQTATITLPPDTIVEDEHPLYLQVHTDANMFVTGLVYQYLPPPVQPEFTTIDPKRVYDSRRGGGKLGDAQERTISVAEDLDGNEVVPAGARGVAVTLTVTLTEGAGGYVSAFPAGITWPGTSSINWFGPGQNLATSVILGLGGDRQITLRGGVALTDVIVDVTGYLL